LDGLIFGTKLNEFLIAILKRLLQQINFVVAL